MILSREERNGSDETRHVLAGSRGWSRHARHLFHGRAAGRRAGSAAFSPPSSRNWQRACCRPGLFEQWTGRDVLDGSAIAEWQWLIGGAAFGSPSSAWGSGPVSSRKPETWPGLRTGLFFTRSEVFHAIEGRTSPGQRAARAIGVNDF